MRIFWKTGLTIILSAAIVGAPAMAAPANPVSAPLGVVLQADRAQTGVDTTMNGATIYDGDRLQTDYDGTLRVSLGGPQMYFRQHTAAQVHALPKGFSADLTMGTVVVSSKEGQAFQLLADGAVISPADGKPVVAQVTYVSPKELLLSSTHGALKVAMGSEVKTVEEGGSYRMEVESDASQPGPDGVATPTAKNKFVWVVVGAIVGGTAYGIYRATESNP